MSITQMQQSGLKPLTRKEIAWRAAQDIADGSYVNLGIGLPTLIADYVVPGREIVYHSENGILGIGSAPPPGKEDPDLVNAGKQFITILPGGSYFHSGDAFAMMRGGHLTMVFMGAFQVAENGDLANWATNDASALPAVGGAMDLAAGCKDIRVLIEHTTKEGKPRIVNRCSYPLTAKQVVKKIYTDLAVIDVTSAGLVVSEMVEGLSFDTLQNLTEAPLILDKSYKRLDVGPI